MVIINAEIIEEIICHFGRTGSKKRPRIRKFHAELLLTKYNLNERVLNRQDIQRPSGYLTRMVRYSQGWLEFINEEALEMLLTDKFFQAIEQWQKQYADTIELDPIDENLSDQGILLTDEGLTFDGRLIYSKFFKLISDESENMNDPAQWLFNTKNILAFDKLNFGQKNSPAFSSQLFLLKFYVLRKIDEVAFVTSRFIQCPKCNASYVAPAAKIDFQVTYRCENMLGEGKVCNTPLKKFPARKMIPTYIYEIAVEVQGKEGVEYKEFFLESFIELHAGFFNGMVFGRTEQRTNSFYFTCLTAREEKSKIPFALETNEENSHNFFNIVDSVVHHIKKIGFVIDTEKARLPVIIETLKKLTLVVNKEINLDHSLYFGAPGIGKTYALTLLHYMFYSNAGFISGPRFSLPGLTGGQKEILYQDTSKRKNVPGLFSNQAFLFDEINNAQFLQDDRALNLFKSVALSPSGTSSTVGGKEFARIALVAGTANYDIGHLKHYENKIKKIYAKDPMEQKEQLKKQPSFLDQIATTSNSIPPDFDFYASLRSYGPEISKALKLAILKIRDGATNYLTNFPKPLMERFYWAILVHPKYDRVFLKQKKIDVLDYLQARKSKYTQRELFSQLFTAEFDNTIKILITETEKKFAEIEIEKKWSQQVKEFLNAMAYKYPKFFSMFQRINQVHVFTLYGLSLINQETELSFATKRVFERLISLNHTPIDIKDFHKPDFEDFNYLGETRGELFKLFKDYPDQDIRDFVDFDNRKSVRDLLKELEKTKRIQKYNDYYYRVIESKHFKEVEKYLKLNTGDKPNEGKK